MSEQTSNELKQQHDTAHAAAVEYWDRCDEYARGFGIFTIYEGPTFAENELAENARSLIAEIDRRNCSGLQGPEDRKAWREQFLLALKGELERRGNARQFFGLLASQCREILKEVAKGWASPRPAGGECWNSGHCGEIAYHVNGWMVVVSWDCGDWDCIESVTTPDGRSASLDDFTLKPDDMLGVENREHFNRMVKAFKQAQPQEYAASDTRP